MKLKTKLIVAFFTIVLVPIIVVYLGISIFTNVQLRAMGAELGKESIVDFFEGNAVQLINSMTTGKFQQLQADALGNPWYFEDKNNLDRINAELQTSYSFLIVRQGGLITYQGSSVIGDQFLRGLPSYGTESDATRYQVDPEDGETYLIKQQDYTDVHGRSSSLFIVTTVDQLLPQMRSLITEMGFILVLLLVMVSFVMSMWTYRAILQPLGELQKATREIKNGNLDYELDVAEQDEIGQLCQDFEEMRQRLKESAEEKIQYDMENKELISNISHDLRTPITAIKGYCEGIMDGVASSPEKMDKYVRTIYNKAIDMDRLIDELTFYSKIDTNKIPYVFAKLDVGTYFADCVEELSIDLESKNIIMSFHNDVDKGTLIIADPEQLNRVINNIVGNSVKYMDKSRGQVIIRLKDVGDFVQVEIEDNGKGIAQKDLPNVFDRFYRADSSRNSAQGGSGIGLSIVKKIVEDHGGKIWATSKEGSGTVMHFVLRKYQEVLHE